MSAGDAACALALSREVLEAAPDPALLVDSSGLVSFASSKAEELFASARDAASGTGASLLGENLASRIFELDRARLLEVLRAAHDTRAPQSCEVKLCEPEPPRPLSLRVSALASEPTTLVVFARDLTLCKRVEFELAAAQRLAAVGTLAAGIAHEINTPIQFVSDSVHFLRGAADDLFTFIDALSELKRSLERGATGCELDAAVARACAAEEAADFFYLRDNVPQAFTRCVDGLGRVAAIVRSMKEFSHPAQKEMASVDLNRAILATLTLARNEYKYVADLETDLGEIAPVTCHVNDVNQVVLNLVVNAAHAITEKVKDSGARGKIRVSTRQLGDSVLVSVRDTGNGIPENIRSRIFERFFTTKPLGVGTGQGLAIARSIIVDRHGGELSFESEVGAGSAFCFRLPLAPRPLHEACALDPASARTPNAVLT